MKFSDICQRGDNVIQKEADELRIQTVIKQQAYTHKIGDIEKYSHLTKYSCLFST